MTAEERNEYPELAGLRGLPHHQTYPVAGVDWRLRWRLLQPVLGSTFARSLPDPGITSMMTTVTREEYHF